MKTAIDQTVAIHVAEQIGGWVVFLIFGLFLANVLFGIWQDRRIARFPPAALVRCGWLTMMPLGDIAGQNIAHVQADEHRFLRSLIWGPPVRARAFPLTWAMGQIVRFLTISIGLLVGLLLGYVVVSGTNLLISGFVAVWLLFAYGGFVWSGRRRWPDRLGATDVMRPQAWDKMPGDASPSPRASAGPPHP